MSKAAPVAASPLLSVVVPALNEAKRIGSTLDALADYLKRADMLDSEVLIVIADSRDDTVGVATAKLRQFQNARIIESGPVVGKGHQVKQGMLQAIGGYRLFMDADLATPIHHIDSALAALDGGADVAIAVRDLARIHTGMRKYISEFSNLVARLVLRLPFADTQCGFKAFRGEVAQVLFQRQRIMRWVFDMEVLAIARKHHYRVVSFKVPDWSDVPDGTFQKVGLRDSLATLADVAKIRWALWRGVYS